MSDYKKLLKFAKLIGVKVSLLPKNGEDHGMFVYSKAEPEIELYFAGARKDSEVILTLLHELGHAVDWIEKGRPHENEIPAALEGSKKMDKANRRIVFEYEQRAIKNMKWIYQLLNLKLPVWKLERERRFDLWIAQSFLKNGTYPSLQARHNYQKELSAIISSKNRSSWSLM